MTQKEGGCLSLIGRNCTILLQNKAQNCYIFSLNIMEDLTIIFELIDNSFTRTFPEDF